MGAVPKRRISKGRKARRRSADNLKKQNLVQCQKCKSLKRPHEACRNCGYYAGKEVVESE